MIPKFRAWHNELKMMRDVFTMRNIGYDTDLLVDTYGTPADDTLFMWSIAEIELMQWTGLQDKHGKDIYEGDIVEDNFGRYKIQRGHHSGWEALYKNEDSQAQQNLYFTDTSAAKKNVIGNIYENPELLNSNKEI